jgi:3-dehydroquinate dehydratase-2
MSRLIYVINGPNLNLLGTRQPEVYGRETLADVERDCRALAKTLDLEVAFHQSNFEGGVIDFIHDARLKAAGVIINAGAYTHTSIGIHDALKILDVPIIEVHTPTSISGRVSPPLLHLARGKRVIVGCGTQGYHRLAAPGTLAR